MQLKDIGTIEIAISAITKGQLTAAAATQGMTLEIAAQTMAAAGLSEQLIIDNLVLNGFTLEDAKAAASAAVASAAMQGQAASTGVLTGVTKSLTATLRGLWATMMAHPLIAIGAALAAAALAMKKYDQKQQELRQSMIQSAKAASDETKSITDLYNAYQEASTAYENNQISKDELDAATDRLIEGLGRERGEIETLIGVYGSLDNAMRNVAANSLREKRGEIVEGVKAAEEEVVHACQIKTRQLCFPLSVADRRSHYR